MKLIPFSICLFIGLSSTMLVKAEERLAILEFRNLDKAVSTSELAYIGEIFRALGAKMGKRGLIIMTKENILQLLPPGKSLEQCIGECEVETGRNIGADYILSGEVIKIGSGYRLAAKIHNTKSGGLIGSEIYEGKDFDLLEKDIHSNTKKDIFRPLRSTVMAADFQEKTFGEKADKVQSWEDSSPIVQFESNPSGAFVEVDGSIVCQQTPCSKEVTLGSHEIAFKLMQYLPLTEQIDVKKDMQPISRTLKADFGLVTLKTEPNDGLEVFLDDKSIGKTPLSEFKVEPRPHKLVVKADGYYEKGVEFKIERGEKREFNLKSDPKLGALRIAAKDSKGNDVVADVDIDGKSLGKTPWQGTLVVGNHLIKVMHDSGTWQESYFIKNNEKQQIVADLMEEESGVKDWVKVGEGIYKDAKTRVTCARSDGKAMNWQTAIDHCKNLTFGGVRRWRLPDKDELIMAYNHGIWGLKDTDKLNLFWGDNHTRFWSGTTASYDQRYAWYVGLNVGGTDYDPKDSMAGVLCVRSSDTLSDNYPHSSAYTSEPRITETEYYGRCKCPWKYLAKHKKQVESVKDENLCRRLNKECKWENAAPDPHKAR